MTAFLSSEKEKRPLAFIIEDDQDMAAACVVALEEAGYDSIIINDGQTATALLASRTPALVLLDLHLPYVSGEEILKQIRTDERLTKTRVVIISADPTWVRFLKHDADFALVKPIGFRQLRDLVQRLHPSQKE